MTRTYEPSPGHFRILVEVDRELLGAIDSLAEERDESRQALLGRFLEGGLKRERRRLRRQEQAGGAPQAAANSRRLNSRTGRVLATPGPREVS